MADPRKRPESGKAASKSGSPGAKTQSKIEEHSMQPAERLRVADELQKIIKEGDLTSSFQHVFVLSSEHHLLTGNAESVNMKSDGQQCTVKDANLANFLNAKFMTYARFVAEQAKKEAEQPTMDGEFRACVFSYDKLVASVRAVPDKPGRMGVVFVAITNQPGFFAWQFSRDRVIDRVFNLLN